MAKLEVNHLSISFRTNNGAVRAVRDVSFKLNEGETLAIAGESGSGKSVTTRAVMGILAGNAMVDDGEIIYDGKDLLKIPEEEFHSLRGHKLAMVFQDPLSALNPIMKIGDQLTEAMILNNKERRADGKASFNRTISLINSRIDKAMADEPQESRDKAHRLLNAFDKVASHSVALENAYRNSYECATESLDHCNTVENALLQGNESKVRQSFEQLLDALKRITDGWLLANEQDAMTEWRRIAKEKARGYHQRDSEACKALLDDLRAWLNRLLAKTEPDFFSLGYRQNEGEKLTPGLEPIEATNAKAKADCERGLLRDVLDVLGKVLKCSEEEALQKKARAVEVLDQELSVFAAETLNRKNCEASLKRCVEAVEDAIDRLSLEKDNPSYVFSGTMNGYIQRYFLSLTHNPKEERRFRKDTLEHDKLVRKGKHAASVVPKNLIDTEAAHRNMVRTVSQLRTHLQELVDAGASSDYEPRSRAMVAYLEKCAADYGYHLTKGMAKHRAIELIKEVGISEPYERYNQYPFSISGGMRQRIVIAIALSANPDILICDEPTTALDVTIQAQILELINRLKRERKLSVIFITHDLGVVANMADQIAIMYAGKIVEFGTADDVFYDPRHPYTWALLSSMPDLETKEKLAAIPGTPPNMILPPVGDAFAARNQYAMEIDLEEQPPMFPVSETHSAATWLLHPDAPKVTPPAIVTERIERMRRREREKQNAMGGEQA